MLLYNTFPVSKSNEQKRLLLYIISFFIKHNMNHVINDFLVSSVVFVTEVSMISHTLQFAISRNYWTK